MFDKLQPAWSCDVEKYTVPFYNVIYCIRQHFVFSNFGEISNQSYRHTNTQIHTHKYTTDYRMPLVHAHRACMHGLLAS